MATLTKTNLSLLEETNSQTSMIGNADRGAENDVILEWLGKWGGNTVAGIEVLAGPDTTNKDDGKIVMKVASGGVLAEAMRIDENQNVVIGKGDLAAAATDGFLHIPVVSGTPTGTPTEKAGFVPICFDEDATNGKLYIYDFVAAAWKSLTVA